ncbi:MAG: hypothetical protein ABR568_09940 [Pyrinomonadaceae bacterium]
MTIKLCAPHPTTRGNIVAGAGAVIYYEVCCHAERGIRPGRRKAGDLGSEQRSGRTAVCPNR